MKLYSLSVLSGKPTASRAAEYDLTSFNFFQRSSVMEFMGFTAKTIADRTMPGQRQMVTQDEYYIFCQVRPDGLAGVAISDSEYPQRVAFAVISKVLEDFSASVPLQDLNTPFPQLRETLVKYQDPKSADSIMRVQQELDETMVVMHNNINQLLERGEKIDDLVAKSEGLSTLSKAFYKQAKKTNSCCSMM